MPEDHLSSIVVTLEDLEIGQVAYERGVVDRSEFEEIPPVTFGCGRR